MRRCHASLAQARQVSVAQIALAWLLGKPFVSSVIIGAKSMDQLRDNIAAVRVVLTEEEIKMLDDVSQLPPNIRLDARLSGAVSRQAALQRVNTRRTRRTRRTLSTRSTRH